MEYYDVFMSIQACLPEPYGIGVAKTMDPAGFGDAGGAVLPEYTAFVHY